MCGIIAILYKNPAARERISPLYDEIVDVVAHRGPDGRGFYEDDSVFLGHRRLAIIDLSEGGHQPMKAFSNGGSQQIVFNGEIYNYIELREALKQEGVSFETESDTEVLLKGLTLKGPELLPSLNGMFSFALWDTEKKELLLVRDRFGIKPLYYYEEDDLVAFASEMKSLLPFVQGIKPNDGVIYDFLHYGRVDHIDETFFKCISRFPAGSYAKVKGSGWQPKRWYSLAENVNELISDHDFLERSTTQHIDEVRKRFFRAVELRMRSDVPVGSCLSGGIDSSSIVTTASTMLEDPSSGIFQTYSAVYGDWFSKDESRYIKEVLQSCNLPGNYITPTVEDLEETFSEFLYYQEEPVTSTAPFSQYYVMKLANSKGAKVLLDGQGADEILAGYEYMVGYYLAELLKKGKIPRFVKELLPQVQRKNTFGLRTARAIFIPRNLRKAASSRAHPLLNRNFANHHKERRIVEKLLHDPPNLNQGLFNHVVAKLQHLLRWEDRSAMAFSIETRVPFLDHRFVEYIIALPPEYKIKNGITKWVLREALKDILPKSIAARTDKIGFATPEANWLAKKGLTLIEKILTDAHPYLATYVDKVTLERILNTRNIELLDEGTQKLFFRILSLQTWLEIFFKNELPERSK
ncbi:MAG: asparagine synthase (glutamine-hydrolyzing) [Candidatus Thorarchaeota archaeon]